MKLHPQLNPQSVGAREMMLCKTIKCKITDLSDYIERGAQTCRSQLWAKGAVKGGQGDEHQREQPMR